jgi:hypothetical protein
MHRSVATHLVVLALGLAVGLGAVAVAQTQNAPQARASADADIVRQLKTTNSQLKDINTKLGYNFKKSSLVGLTFEGFNDLYRATVESCNAINRSISGSSFDCPSFVH